MFGAVETSQNVRNQANAVVDMTINIGNPTRVLPAPKVQKEKKPKANLSEKQKFKLAVLEAHYNIKDEPKAT